MNDALFTENVTLTNPGTQAVAARAAVLEEESFLPDGFGTSSAHTAFLLPAAAAPRAGCTIVWNSRTFQIGAVQTCRDLKGRVVCCRCQAG